MSTDLPDNQEDRVSLLVFESFQFLIPCFVFPHKKRRRGKWFFSVYFRFRSAKYATAPMMHAATTAMAIASSVLISGASVVVSGSGSSGVSGVSGVVGSSGVVGCSGVSGSSGSIGIEAEAAGPTVT